MEEYASIRATIVDHGEASALRVVASGVKGGEPLRFPPLEEMTSKQAAAFFLAAVDALDGTGPSVCVDTPMLGYGASMDTSAALVRAAARAIKGE